MSGRTKRSPRAGWTLVELVDGRWMRTQTGDREVIRAAHQERVFEVMREPGGLRHPGRALAQYDANGTRRDEYPTFPRTADGVRIEWPASTPDDGAEPVVFVPRKAAAQ